MPNLLWLTDRGERHQQGALKAAPPGWELKIQRGSDLENLIPLLAEAEILVSERSGLTKYFWMPRPPCALFCVWGHWLTILTLKPAKREVSWCRCNLSR